MRMTSKTVTTWKPTSTSLRTASTWCGTSIRRTPESADIIWSIRGVDEADFTIDSNGVLRFKQSPDFENSTDRGLNLNAVEEGQGPDFTDEGEFAPNNNDYQITVSATEEWDEIDESLPAKRSDRHLTVTVTNEDDKGELTLKWLQPEVGTPISAELTDEDDTVADSGTFDDDGETVTRRYTWYISKVPGIPQVGVPTPLDRNNNRRRRGR